MSHLHTIPFYSLAISLYFLQSHYQSTTMVMGGVFVRLPLNDYLETLIPNVVDLEVGPLRGSQV